MIRNYKRSLAALLGCVLSVPLCTVANATTITVNSVGIYDTVQVNLSGITNGHAFNENAYSTAISLHETSPSTSTIWVFCVDIFHNVGLGGGQNLSYMTTSLTSDNNPNTNT